MCTPSRTREEPDQTPTPKQTTEAEKGIENGK